MGLLISQTRFFRSCLGIWALGLFALAEPSPLRWVSTSPQVTELIFQLGQGHQLVGTSDQTFYPEAAKQLPRVGLLFNPNLEAVMAQRPTGIFWDESSYRPELELKLLELGVKSVRLNFSTVENLFISIRKINEVFGSNLKTPELVESESAWKKAQTQRSPFTFIALAWAEPAILFGKDTFLVNLLEELGGSSVLPSAWAASYPKVSAEWLIAQNPDYLFYLKHDDSSALFFQKRCQKWWPNRPGRCVGIPAEKYARASLTPLSHLGELKSQLERKR